MLSRRPLPRSWPALALQRFSSLAMRPSTYPMPRSWPAPSLQRFSSLAMRPSTHPLDVDDSAADVRPRRFGGQRVRPWLAEALRAANFVEPTPVQAMAMDLIAHHQDTVIHSATGSGKTLAFLVPLLSRLDAGVPLQLLVLLPSRELALQVAYEIHQLLVAESQLNLALVIGSASGTAQLQRQLVREVDSRRAEVLVATPEALSRVLGLRRSGAGGGGGDAPSLHLDGDPRHGDPRAAWPVLPGRSRRLAAVEATDGEEDEWSGWPAEMRERAQRRVAAEMAARGPGTPLQPPQQPRAQRYPSLATSALPDAAAASKLLFGLASGLNAIVLDEVDALLPKPILQVTAI